MKIGMTWNIGVRMSSLRSKHRKPPFLVGYLTFENQEAALMNEKHYHSLCGDIKSKKDYHRYSAKFINEFMEESRFTLVYRLLEGRNGKNEC